MTDRRKNLEQCAHRINRAARNAMKNQHAEWYAIFAMAGKEMQVHRALRSWDGVTSFLPLRRKWHRVNRYSKEQVGVARPAIAGCLLVGVPEEPRLHEIAHELDSVYGVLGIGGEAVALDPGRLEEFARSNKFACDGSEQVFKVGDRVRALEGLLSSHSVEIETIVGDFAHVTVQLLGIPTYMSERLDNLERAA